MEQNIYSTELAAELSDSKFIEPGIHENVKFEGVEYFISPTGNKGIRFSFSKNGKTANHVEFEAKKFSERDDLQQKTSKIVRRVKSFMEAFTHEELTFKGNSFKEFADWVIEKISPAVYLDELYRVKFTANSKGFATLPNFIIPPAIQRMSDTELTVVPSDKDVFTAPVVKADKEEVKDDMPF